MTEQEREAVKRRALTDATLTVKHGFAGVCPYYTVDEAELWRKEMERVMAELREKA